ncbi:MAG: FumA C-terminus/TtdB family hydratase beta subunit [Elusimicrobia bacterium]|nr:FumA C-terminus/TtdB family hydratase beta subunit [Elusimicrobiota bacterium]
MNYSLTTTELIAKIPDLKVGDRILLSGIIYTARDAAHKKLESLIKTNQPLPLDLKNSILYYCGPCPAKPGKVIGSCGPTTSSRMDSLTPLVLSKGVKATIGKGPRSKEVVEALKKYKALYLVATGGVGALLAGKVKKCKIVAFEELGPEAIYELEIKEFPVVVGNDINGNDIFTKK